MELSNYSVESQQYEKSLASSYKKDSGMVESFTKVYALVFNMYPAEIRNAGELKQEQAHPGAWKLADEIRQEALSDRSLLKGIARGEISKYIDILSEPCEEAGYKPGIREARIIKELQALLRMSA